MKLTRSRLLSLFIGLLLATGAAEARQPNILFVFADDLAYDAVGFAGNEVVQTPSLDRLASQSTHFTHAYNMGSWSGAVCVASRTMLNTGRFVWQANAVYNQSEGERQAGRWWSEYMKGAGYRTYFTGKWHVKASAEKSFDVARHVRPGMPAQTDVGYNRPIDGQEDPWSPSDPKFGGYWKDGKHWSEIVADDAVGYLQEAASREEPFFMYVAFNAPHDPRQAPKEYLDRYPASEMPVPGNFLPLYPHREAIGAGKSLRDEVLAPFPRTPHAVKVHRKEYYAIINHLDDQIGRILEALEKSGKREETWIVFTADHGLAVGQHGLVGKQNMYDHSLRVPFLIKPPSGEGGRRISAPVYLQDVMPTTLELAGVAKPEHVDFHSVMPLFNGERSASFYPEVYGAYLELQRAIIADGLKLIVYPTTHTLRLYDLAEDPLEMNDLVLSQPAQANSLYTRLLRLEHSLGGKFGSEQ